MTTTASEQAERSCLEFGKRLRVWRRRKGLSQADLGGDKFSGSYVSHVESGRRRATAEMVEFFANKLGLERSTLEGVDALSDAPIDVAVLQVTSLTVQLAHAQRNHDFDHAASLAAQAAEAASRAGLPERWWLAMQQQAIARFENGDYHPAFELSAQLIGHHVAQGSTALKLEAKMLAGRSARAAGQLSQAEEFARRAIELADLDQLHEYRAEALTVLVGILMDQGRTDEATEVGERLLEVRDLVGSDQMRGVCYWIGGNLALLVGDRQGIADHDVADRLLRPEVDLRMWGRFHKASAQGRLAGGITEGVAGHIEKARQAILLVGNDSDRTELRLVEARLALSEDRLSDAENLVRYCLGDDQLASAPHSRAESEVTLGDVLEAQHRWDEAKQVLREAAIHFEEAGALRRSVAMWRRHAQLADSSGEESPRGDTVPQVVNIVDK